MAMVTFETISKPSFDLTTNSGEAAGRAVLARGGVAAGVQFIAPAYLLRGIQPVPTVPVVIAFAVFASITALLLE